MTRQQFSTGNILNSVYKTFVSLGLLAILVQIGEWKERFVNLQQDVAHLMRMMDVNAAEHRVIRNEIIEITGKPIKD